MALKKCKECGQKVSTKASSCPNCGAKPPKKTSLFTWIVTILSCAIVYIVVTSPPSTIPNKPKPTLEELAAKEAEEKKEAEMQESLRALREKERNMLYQAKNTVANSLKDPESAKFKNVFYSYGSTVCGQVNAKNAHGAYTGFQHFIFNHQKVFYKQDLKNFETTWIKFCKQ